MEYNYIFDRVYREASYLIIKQLKLDFDDDMIFETSISNIRNFITNHNGENIIGKNKTYFETIARNFNQHESYYKKGTPISKTINKIILIEYNELHKQTIYNKKNEEINNYTFEKFIYDLIVFDTLQKIVGILYDNSKLYELFYVSNNYEKFTLDQFEGHVINSDLYRSLFSKIYPNKNIPIAVKRINEYGNPFFEIIDNTIELNKPILKVETRAKIIKQNFELDEQLLIINLCIVDKNNIPTTEKAKLIILIGEIKNDSIFKESSSINLVYQKINNGILRKGSPKNMLSIINSILTKIESYDLTSTNQTLKRHKANLISEQNNTKK